LSPETRRADLKRLINEKVVASCSLFTAFRIVEQSLANVALGDPFAKDQNVVDLC